MADYSGAYSSPKDDEIHSLKRQLTLVQTELEKYKTKEQDAALSATKYQAVRKADGNIEYYICLQCSVLVSNTGIHSSQCPRRP